MFRNSRSQIVFRTDIFRKLTLGTPEVITSATSAVLTSHKPFQGEGHLLFAEPAEDVEGQDSDKLHFEPVIPVLEDMQIVTGEKGPEMIFLIRENRENKPVSFGW